MTYSNCGLDLLKQTSPQSFNQIAKRLLCYSTNFDLITSHLDEKTDLALSPEKVAEKAIEYGCYKEAIDILNKSIQDNFIHSSLYLDMSAAHFGLGNYLESIQHFKKFQASTEIENQHSTLEIAQAFSKSLVRGVKDSFNGICILFYDLVQHPIHSTTQFCKAFSQLVDLAKNQEWNLLAEILVPEAYELVSNWDSLDNPSKGDLLGYVIGKYGADFMIPGTIAKVTSKSLSKARQLDQIYSGQKRSERLLLLESMTAIESATELNEIVQANQKIMAAGNELNLSIREMYQLKEAGKLDGTLHTVCENMFPTVLAKESFELFQKAEASLRPYRNKIMPEMQVRELIQSTGVKTYPRPSGIPGHFQVCISKKGAGIKYVDPVNPQNSIRVMPGKPHSHMPYQQNPYVIRNIEGNVIDKFGKIVDSKAPEAHIPLNEFIY